MKTAKKGTEGPKKKLSCKQNSLQYHIQDVSPRWCNSIAKQNQVNQVNQASATLNVANPVNTEV